ncbi:MAG: hypothetical protein E7183_01205 [Erysipelotrichaceae bacterium]|nr:hypothetical protein [Erysipelotrichaceae bacterium]
MKKIYLIIIFMLCLLIGSCDYTPSNNNSNNDLFNALKSNNNYTYFIEYDDGVNKYQKEVLYDNGTFQVIVDDSNVKMVTLCYEEKSDSSYIIKTLNDDKSIEILENEKEFTELKEKYLDEVYLNVLSVVDFEFISSKYVLKDDRLDIVKDKLFDLTIDGEVSNLYISLNNGCVGNLSCEITTLEKAYTVLVEFYKYGNTNVEIPVISEENPIVRIVPSSKLIKVESGTTLSDAISTLYLTVMYEDGSSDTINVEDLSYTSSDYNSEVPGTYEVLINAFEQEVIINIEVVNNSYYLPEDLETLNQYADKNGVSYGLPSTGNSKALVIPVEFTDAKAKLGMKENLEKAFFGTSEDTGWESLTSYYNKSSYGKLNIEGTVLDVYNTNKTSSYYNRKYKAGEDADYLIIKSALEYYDSVINYDEYDSNNDGYIDALYIVYTAPIDYVDDNSMWWAYTYEYYTDDYEFYDNVEVDYYCFFGYDFLFEIPACEKSLTLNTETIIHETGHLLGLDDYYDYDDSKGPDGGLGGGDMMDYNVGDHNPFSKILLGWATPYIVTNSCEIVLDPFYLSGKCILLIDEFNSIFDEYYLIDYYCPDGLNKLEAGYNGLFSTSGIRIYHVDATLSDEEVYGAYEIYKYNNTDTAHKLIKLVQASGKNTIEKNELSCDDDLFSLNKNYTLNSWYNNKNLSFTFNAAMIYGSSSVEIKINLS